MNKYTGARKRKMDGYIEVILNMQSVMLILNTAYHYVP